MPIRALPVRLTSVLPIALAVAMAGGPSDWHDDETPDGSRVCLGSLGMVFCVPPEQMPPSPPSAPTVPSVPTR